jgi:hypothetical protein
MNIKKIIREEINESVKLPIEIGDTVYMGKFKNKKTIVKDIEWNEKGDLMINGKSALRVRIPKKKKLKESDFDWVDSSRTPQVGETILSMGGHYSRSSGFSPLEMVVLNVDGYADSDKICFRVMADTPFRRCDTISEFMDNLNDGTYEYE